MPELNTAAADSSIDGTEKLLTLDFEHIMVSALREFLTPAIVTDATSARTIDPATDAGSYIRFTATGAKTCTFDDGDGFTVGDEYHITNRATSGNLTLTEAGTMTLNPPKGGTLVLEPDDTVTVKIVATGEADVIGSTEPV